MTHGVYAKTYYTVIKNLENINASILKVRLETGRTHQIRVHMKHIGHPLLGDFLYGKSSDLIDRQALHSYSIEFIHPITKIKINLKAELPIDFLMFGDGGFPLKNLTIGDGGFPLKNLTENLRPRT